jgi:hypothetical protein
MRGIVPKIIVELGLFKGMDYLPERSARAIAGKTGLGRSRLRSAPTLVADQIRGGREAHP